MSSYVFNKILTVNLMLRILLLILTQYLTKKLNGIRHTGILTIYLY